MGILRLRLRILFKEIELMSGVGGIEVLVLFGFKVRFFGAISVICIFVFGILVFVWFVRE